LEDLDLEELKELLLKAEKAEGVIAEQEADWVTKQPNTNPNPNPNPNPRLIGSRSSLSILIQKFNSRSLKKISRELLL